MRFLILGVVCIHMYVGITGKANTYIVGLQSEWKTLASAKQKLKVYYT